MVSAVRQELGWPITWLDEQNVNYFTDNILKCILWTWFHLFYDQISLKFIPESPIDNKSAPESPIDN